jgi:hypothetical protein
MSDKNIKKLLKLEKRLYGRNTTDGYMDYEYSVKIPKKLTIEKFDEKLEIKPYVDDTKISKLHLNFDEIKNILQDSSQEKKKKLNPFL